MITQILNFGLPSPIDIQISGTDINDNRVVADRILRKCGNVRGIVDARIQQEFDYPDVPYRSRSDQGAAERPFGKRCRAAAFSTR